MKPRDRIGEFLEELGVGAMRELFGYVRPRSGKLGLTLHGFQKMQEEGLDVKTLEDAFRHGVEVRDKMIIREYANYTVGLTYGWNETGTGYLIITCWKRGGEQQHVRF